MKYLGWFRAGAQILVIALFCILPWLNLKGWHDMNGSLFAFDFFGIPFADPASAAQATIAGLAESLLPLSTYYYGAIISLVIAMIFGRVFCGWLCPYGFFSEALHNLRLRENFALSSKARNTMWLCKCAWLAAGLAACAFVAYPFITVFSMPGSLSLLPVAFWSGESVSFILLAASLPIVLIITELACKRRIWCEYLCPQSVLLGLMARVMPAKLPALRIVWQPEQCGCGKASPCRAACTMNLNPRQKNGPPRRDCTMCGACVSACASCGKALSYKL